MISIIIYCDLSTHFNNINLKDYLQTKEIALIHASAEAHKFVKQIKKTNDIL